MQPPGDLVREHKLNVTDTEVTNSFAHPSLLHHIIMYPQLRKVCMKRAQREGNIWVGRVGQGTGEGGGHFEDGYFEEFEAMIHSPLSQ